MPTFDPNELAKTVIDQAHTIRRMGEELDRRAAELADAISRLAELEARLTEPSDESTSDG